MTITFPLSAGMESKMQPQNARLNLAIGAFVGEEVTLGQAAEIAGISQPEMMGELSRWRIPLHHGVEEFEEDLKNIEVLGRTLTHADRQ
ncbi:MAG: UPF0175 family protein [Prosthecobacter sp.]